MGTPSEKLQRSSFNRRYMFSPERLGPGSTSLAPHMAPAYGMPQALTWNSGTTSSTLSRADRPRPSVVQAVKECRTVERWL
ncbi:hypothetical protein D9M68_952110 [compost metagenome]